MQLLIRIFCNDLIDSFPFIFHILNKFKLCLAPVYIMSFAVNIKICISFKIRGVFSQAIEQSTGLLSQTLRSILSQSLEFVSTPSAHTKKLYPKKVEFFLAFPRGVEPPAYRLGGGRSIQLSYGNIMPIKYNILERKIQVENQIYGLERAKKSEKIKFLAVYY